MSSPDSGYEGNVVWGGSYNCDLNKLEQVSIDGMRLVTGATAYSNVRKLYNETGWLSIRDQIDRAKLMMFYKTGNLNFLLVFVKNAF